MRLADELLLAQIRESLLSHIPDDQWKQVQEEVEKAGGVREVGGYAGTLIRDAIEKKSKVETVMSEFKSGKLKSSSGKKVKSRKQAIAIALSEQRRAKKKEVTKASFGGNRSEAGRYAAQQRWKGHTKGQASPETKARITAQARASAEAKTKFPGVRTVITGEPASPSREQQKEFNRFVKLNDDRRSLERAVQDAKDRVQAAQKLGEPSVIRRMEKLQERLEMKLNAVNEQIDKEFPVPKQSAEPSGTAVPKAQPSDTPESNIQNIDQRIKEAKAQLEEVKYDPMQYRQRRIIELRIKRLQEVKREQGAKIKIKTLTESKEAQPKRENIDADKKLVSRNERGEANIRGQNRDSLERQVNANIKALEDIESGKLTPYKWGQVKSKKVARESLLEIISRGRASLAAIDEFEDETSPGYFAS